MAYIELVIKIPEEGYRWIKKSDKTVFADVASKECMLHAIKNGTPLPKGHGDLVDISPYKGKVICSHLYSGVKKLIEVDSIEPIIGADKED